MGQDLRRAQAAGVPMPQFQEKVNSELQRFRTRTNMSPELADVGDQVGQRLSMIELLGNGPEAYEALGLELLGGKKPEPIDIPGAPATQTEQAAGDATATPPAAGKLPPWTDTLVLSYSSDFAPAEREWLQAKALERSAQGQTVERLGGTAFAALIAEKMGEHVADGTAVSPGFAGKFEKLTREGNRPDLEKKLAGKIKVDETLAPAAQATQGGVQFGPAATGFGTDAPFGMGQPDF